MTTTTTASANGTHLHHLGLLRGVDYTVDNFYADQIDMSEQGLAWLDEPGLLWEAAKKDAMERNVMVEEYICAVTTNLQTFQLSGNIHDHRAELLRHLNDAFMVKGAFTLVLGGRNVGKSIVLKRLAKVNNLNKTLPSNLLVLYVDGRLSCGRLEVGLANGIAQLLAAEPSTATGGPTNWVEVLRRQSIDLGCEAAIETTLSKITVDDETTKTFLRQIFYFMVKSVLPRDTGAEVSKRLLEMFIKMAKDRQAFPVLVIDEANAVLGMEDDDNNHRPGNIILTSLASYTKQDAKLNVIMASSEHSYLYRLKREGLHLEFLQNIIFAGEIPPREMWKLLVSAKDEIDGNKPLIGMGPHLAELCLTAYGGHFWNVERAIQDLPLGRDGVRASAYIPSPSSDIIKCLESDIASRPLLHAMAKHGFVAVATPDNAVVRHIDQQPFHSDAILYRRQQRSSNPWMSLYVASRRKRRLQL